MLGIVTNRVVEVGLSNLDREKSSRRLEFAVAGTTERVSGLLVEPPSPRLVYLVAHGAGAGMGHPFLEALAERLTRERIATFRYQFPYMEAGRRRPDPPGLLEATVRSAVDAASRETDGLLLVAGGKSMGGRMTSSAAAKTPLPGVGGLIFLGFPLHSPNSPGIGRAAHLDDVGLPMLFLQGARDGFAKLDLLAPVCQRLRPPATLHIVEGGDHSFKVLKRLGRTNEEVMEELAGVISNWCERVFEV